MTLLTNARLVTPAAAPRTGWLRVAAGRIAGLGDGVPPTDEPGLDLAGGWVLPGLIDVHVHGGGGAAFSDGPEGARHAAAFHRRHGTTRTFASLVTASLPDLERQVAVLADLVEDGTLAGIHLEGPFLAAARCGAQDPRYMIDPDPAALDRLVAAGRGHVRLMTVAPERPSALDLIKRAVDAGVTVAVGHTDATYAQTMAAFQAGARHVTHLFNGMRPPHHREPGPIYAAFEHDEVVCEAVLDGVHLHDGAVRVVARTIGADRLVGITDAIAAAGMSDGPYRLGPLDVRVVDGVARLAQGNSLAGSTATMATVLRQAVRHVGLPVADAAMATATVPARVAGIASHTGALITGHDADLIVCDDDMTLTAVMSAGQWITGPWA
jgi:N-acetylglucosamine-6-phosphate deacetylase